VLGGALLVLVVSSVAVIALVSASRAPSAGAFEVAGIEQLVSIRFDPRGRPYVTAQSLADALFTEGFLHVRRWPAGSRTSPRSTPRRGACRAPRSAATAGQ
jgi:acyl-homoserine lactone acylase PvdQ